MSRKIPGRTAILALALLSLLSTGGCLRASPATEPGAVEQSDVLLARRLDSHFSAAAAGGFNGTVLIARADRMILHKGYGFADRERRRPVTTATPFWIVSVSKSFTAAAILSLAERGRLSLDDPIGRFLPDVPDDKRPITIRQLLTHSAGLADADAADGMSDREAAARAILSTPLAGSPGSAYRYTNDAYVLLAMIVERAAGEPYDSYVQRRLLAPARLRRTGFWGPREHPEVAVILPTQWGEPAILQPNWGYRGPRGMHSTAADLHAWYRALSRNRILSATNSERVFAVQVPQGSGGVGYGWFVAREPGGTRLWARGNQGSGHGALVAAWPDRQVVMVIVSNSDRYAPGVPMGHRLAAEASAILFEAQPQ
jgi:CubicO group peptidase (beta-lactamase class C family)